MWKALWGGNSSNNNQKEPECWTHFLSAIRKLQMGQTQEAYQGFLYSLQLDDEYKLEQRISPLMKLLESQQKFEEMLSLVAKFETKHANALGLLVWKGVALRHLDRLEECQACFAKAVESQPKNEMFATLYNAVLITREQWSTLSQVSQRMIEFYPMSGTYHNNYIQSLENLKQDDKARAYVQAIWDKYGALSASVGFICGDFYYKHDEYDRAEKCLQKAAELDVENEKYQQYYMRALLQNGKQEAADKYCHALIAKDENNARWINTVGYICFDAFDFEAAAKHFERCCALDPSDPYNVVDLAMVYCELDRLEEALRITQQVLDKHPSFISAQYRMARILEYQHKYGEARQLYEAIRKVDGRKAKINMGYAHLLYLMGEYAESMKFFKIAAVVDKANPWYHFWFGLLCMTDAHRSYAQALKSFEECLRLQATHHKCHFELAMLLFKVLRKNKKKAKHHLQEAMRIDYKNERYRQALQEFMDDGDDGDDDDEKEVGNIVEKLVRKEYIFKSMDHEKKSVTVMDEAFEEIVLGLKELSVQQMQDMNGKIEQGAKNKKDVKIVVIETHKQNEQVSHKISHALV